VTHTQHQEEQAVKTNEGGTEYIHFTPLFEEDSPDTTVIQNAHLDEWSKERKSTKANR
jgi:hypothetical protein